MCLLTVGCDDINKNNSDKETSTNKPECEKDKRTIIHDEVKDFDLTSKPSSGFGYDGGVITRTKDANDVWWDNDYGSSLRFVYSQEKKRLIAYSGRSVYKNYRNVSVEAIVSFDLDNDCEFHLSKSIKFKSNSNTVLTVTCNRYDRNSYTSSV